MNAREQHLQGWIRLWASERSGCRVPHAFPVKVLKAYKCPLPPGLPYIHIHTPSLPPPPPPLPPLVVLSAVPPPQERGTSYSAQKLTRRSDHHHPWLTDELQPVNACVQTHLRLQPAGRPKTRVMSTKHEPAQLSATMIWRLEVSAI